MEIELEFVSLFVLTNENSNNATMHVYYFFQERITEALEEHRLFYMFVESASVHQTSQWVFLYFWLLDVSTADKP